MNLKPTTGHTVAEMHPKENNQACGSKARDFVDCGHDVSDITMRFIGIHVYLSVASVSTRWRHAWGKRQRVTSLKWAVQSCACLDWASGCGLHISHKPCLLAAAEGRLDVLEHAVSLGYSREGMPICERAAAGGHLEVVKWCRANGYPWGLSKRRAAKGGHLEVLQWCVASNAPSVARNGQGRSDVMRESEVLNEAVEGGQLETVIWCVEQGYRWNERTSYLAAKGGHLELLRWLRDKGCPWSLRTMSGAAAAGDLVMLSWCRATGCPWNKRFFRVTAGCGNLKVVRWYASNDPRDVMHHWGCREAAAGGHLEVVQWLRGMGCRWGRNLSFHVACGGHFEVLKWCVSNGCPWENVPPGEFGYKFRGTIPMMVWANANGCPWVADSSAMINLCWHAARGGNLDVLKWCARNHGIQSSSLLDVARYGHVHVLEWLRAEKWVLDGWKDTRLWCVAASSGSLEMMKWCLVNNIPWHRKTCAAAARSGNLELLQWCRAHGCPWGDGTCETLIQRGDFEMLAWCRDNGCPPDGKWRETSLRAGYAEMIEWCWESSPSKS